MLEALAVSVNPRDKDAEKRSRLATLYAREMAKSLNFSPDQFKRLEWAVDIQGWSRSQNPPRGAGDDHQDSRSARLIPTYRALGMR